MQKIFKLSDFAILLFHLHAMLQSFQKSICEEIKSLKIYFLNVHVRKFYMYQLNYFLKFFLKKFVFVFVSDLIIPFLFIFSMSLPFTLH